MKASAIIAALQQRVAEDGDLPCEVFLDTASRAGSFRAVIDVAGGDEAIVFSTVSAAHFDRPVCDLPRSMGHLLAEVAKKLNIKRASEIDRDPAERRAVEKLAEEIRNAPCMKCGGKAPWFSELCDHCLEKIDPDGAEEDRRGL